MGSLEGDWSEALKRSGVFVYTAMAWTIKKAFRKFEVIEYLFRMHANSKLTKKTLLNLSRKKPTKFIIQNFN